MKIFNYLVAALIIGQHFIVFGADSKEHKQDDRTHTAASKKPLRVDPLTSPQGQLYCAARKLETVVCQAAKKSKIGYAPVDSSHEFFDKTTSETLCLELPTTYGQYFSVSLPFGTFNFASLNDHDFSDSKRKKLLGILSKTLTLAQKLENKEVYPITKISGVTLPDASTISYTHELSGATNLWEGLSNRYYKRETSKCSKRCSNGIVRLLCCCRDCCSCCRCSKCCTEAMPIN